MSKPRRLLRPPVLVGWMIVLTSILALAAVPILQATLVLKEREQKDLGAALQTLFDAKEGKETDKARKSLNELLMRIGKAQGKKGVEPLQAALSLTADLGRAFFLSEEHKTSGIKLGDVAEGSFTVPGAEKEEKLTYAVWTPKTYKPSGDPPAVILFIPGMKDGKVLSARQFLVELWTDGEIRDQALLVAVDMPPDMKSWGALETPDGKQGGVSVVMRTAWRIRELYAIDYDRFYLAGRETGVATALTIGGMYPQFFAAIVGQTGDCGDANWENFRNLPTFFASGGAACTSFEEKIKAAGYDNCTLQSPATDKDIWSWMQEHKRIANPTKVSLVPATLGPFKSYWLETQRQEVLPGMRVDAEIDRGANKIEIKSEGIRSVTLYFNDVMLDLDKPVKLVLNGSEKEEKIARSLDDTLTLMKRGTSDPGRVYVTSKNFDLPKTGKE